MTIYDYKQMINTFLCNSKLYIYDLILANKLGASENLRLKKEWYNNEYKNNKYLCAI